jgi:hypothetical protein
LTRAREARLCSTRYGPFGHGLLGLGLNVMFLSAGYFCGVPGLRQRTQTQSLDDGRQQSNAAAFPDLLFFTKNRVMSPQLKADPRGAKRSLAGQFLT